MADRNNGVPRRKPVPAPAALPAGWEKDLTQQFRRTLSTKRMNQLHSSSGSLRRSSSRLTPEIVVQSRQQLPTSPQPTTPSHPTREAPSVPGAQQDSVDQLPPPPAYSSLRNIPIHPEAPTENKHLRFRNMLISLSNIPCKWENPGLLDEALHSVPLERIYDEAQEESDLYMAEAASLGGNTKPAWGYQDCVVRALMRWFKRDFFEWINNPPCSACRAPTIGRGMAHPLPDESARGANRVELYQCSNQYCQSYERFPRYNDAFVLLQTRRGRVGEWANCFSMLCRAVGSRVRWVWNAEDHVWTEVYSVHRKRWVHVDCCEEAWDTPLLYTQGWKRQLSYCIAFSADTCADVTRRYVRNPSSARPRQKCPESVLMHIIAEIKTLRRRDMDKKEKFRLEGEDLREDADFRKYIIEALAKDISRILPGGLGTESARTSTSIADAQKAAEARQSTDRLRARNEAHGQRDQRQQ